MDGDVKTFGLEPFWQRQSGFSRQTNIKHARAGITVKMAMFRHIRTKTRRATIEGHLPDQPAFNQRVEAIIDRGHRNFRPIMFGSDKDLFGSRVVAFVQQHGVHLLALGGKTKPAGRQPRIEALIELFIWGHSHGNEILSSGRAAVNIWNNSKCNHVVWAHRGRQIRGSLLQRRRSSGESFARALSRATNCSPVMMVPSSMRMAAPTEPLFSVWA